MEWGFYTVEKIKKKSHVKWKKWNNYFLNIGCQYYAISLRSRDKTPTQYILMWMNYYLCYDWSRRSRNLSNTSTANHDGVPLIPPPLIMTVSPLFLPSTLGGQLIWIHPHVVHIYLHMHIQITGPRFINAHEREACQKLVLAVSMSVFSSLRSHRQAKSLTRVFSCLCFIFWLFGVPLGSFYKHLWFIRA